ncbi:amino acid synthesis family protein [Agrobacterium tumefaciens]|uniref:amino acid synthesis family protein n=1 Tax=Agrobacterium tumefaciens TaxID=358 RepID=UPI001571A8C7|nr:amino acid synthesis family protein [Agrobacterium tumefaciens]NTB94893.1 amino acid synthesis family protein [Agrobacterium tumefaciens]NTC44014.1 amino acid synthesis family protein [Agrobacterium tumefaciens]
MVELKIRKIITQTEDIISDAGKVLERPAQKVTVAAVIENPYAGRYVEDLEPLYSLGGRISELLVSAAAKVIGVPASEMESYGKAAIIGTDGEIEHAAALIHPKFGAPVREAVVGKDIIPSTKKIGAPGAAITFPLTGKTSIWEFDHMDAAEITIPDAPRSNEAVVILALARGGRPLHRIKLP